MIVDASALLAVVLKEKDYERYARAIADAVDDSLISPINYVEAAVRADKLGEEVSLALDEIMQTGNVEIAAVTREQTLLVRDAYRKFGKGNHPARLNLGDCFAYALAKARNEPLLFKGNDFRLTDVEAAL
jgi:ribonuclease VapC